MSYRSLILCAMLFMSITTGADAEQFTTQSIRIDGIERTYHVHKPDAVFEALPLLIVLHGGGGQGIGLKNTYGFQPIIERGEVIAAYPDAINGQWLPNDVAFLDDAIDEIISRERVDPDQLFITGASRGGLMTFIMVATSKHSFQAAGTVIASQVQGLAEQYPISRPISFAMIAGTADPLMPYDGGWGAMGQPRSTGEPGSYVLPVEEVIQGLLNVNSITSDPVISSFGNRDQSDGCTHQVYQWTHSQTGQSVLLVKVEGGGHVVPGGRQYLPKSWIGSACHDFDHAQVMWEFFQEQGRTTASPGSRN